MYCESCGSFINDGEAFCSNCGSPAPRDSAPAAPSPAPAPAPAPQATVQPIAQPVQTAYQPYQQPQYQQPAYQAPAYQQPVQIAQPIYQPVYQQPVIITPINNTRTRVNVAATVGLVLGIITLCPAWIPVVNILPAIPGLIFSIAGVAKKDAGGKGRAITGLIMSSIGLFISILFIIEMIAGELNY